jgi:flagellar M-ring protein FliF
MNGLLAFLRGLGPTRMIIVGSLAAGLVAALVVLTSRLTTPEMSLLYADLNVDDSGDIIGRLEAMNVPYQLKGNGSQVYVPRERILRLRLSMAQEGLPAGGSIGYELFDRSDGFGTTSFVQNINRVRALEGELARTIRTIDQISATRVHLVLPQREVFSRQRRKPSASIIIKMRGGGRLDSGQVKAIQHLVAAAVPELDPDRVSIVDDRGRLLSRRGDKAGGTGSSSFNEARLSYENRLKNAIETLVEQSVGTGKVRAEVSAEMNFDRITTNSEAYDPDGQVVRSTQTLEENTASVEAGGDKAVSISGNLPEAEAEKRAGPQSQNKTLRTEETVNYEISKTVKTEVFESGTVKRLSVAVLIDGRYKLKDDGTRIYEPREQAELDQISALVKSAIGFVETRKDRVEVVNMQFHRFDEVLPEEIEEESFFEFSTSDYIRFGEILAVIVVAIFTLLLVVRPLLAAILRPEKTEPEPERIAAPESIGGLPAPANDAPGLLEKPDIIAAVEAGEISVEEAKQRLAAEAGVELSQINPEAMIDIAQIEGKVRASSVRKVGELVDRHPDEALSILRSWMHRAG